MEVGDGPGDRARDVVAQAGTGGVDERGQGLRRAAGGGDACDRVAGACVRVGVDRGGRARADRAGQGAAQGVVGERGVGGGARGVDGGELVAEVIAVRHRDRDVARLGVGGHVAPRVIPEHGPGAAGDRDRRELVAATQTRRWRSCRPDVGRLRAASSIVASQAAAFAVVTSRPGLVRAPFGPQCESTESDDRAGS